MFILFKKFPIFIVAVCCFANPLKVFAGELHQHIEVTVVNQRVQATFCRPEKGCSLVKPETLGLSAGQSPVDKLTGIPIFVSEFTIFPDRTAIDSPGFEGLEGDLTPGDLVRYKAGGHLSFWDTAAQKWTLAPDGTQLRLAGGLDLQPNQDCGQVICIPKTIEGFTLFDRNGVRNALSLIVGEADANGSLHTHLDWILETVDGGTAPTGAYMVEIQLLTDMFPQPSESLWVMFNNGLPLAEFQEAVTARVLQPNTDTARADQLFAWAEANYPDLFPNQASSVVALGYYARCYDNGACVGIKDNHVFATGGQFGAGISIIGNFDVLATQAGL